MKSKQSSTGSERKELKLEKRMETEKTAKAAALPCGQESWLITTIEKMSMQDVTSAQETCS